MVALGALLASETVACPLEHHSQPLIGEYRAQTQRDAAVLLRVDQLDLDLKVVDFSRGNEVVYAGPGGRNGPEWIYLAAGTPAAHEICLYAVYRQAAPRSYRIEATALSKTSSQMHDAFRLLSDASVSWAANTRSSRLAAANMYEQAANLGVARQSASQYARLYGALAQVQRYAYDDALAQLSKLDQLPSMTAQVAYLSNWTRGAILNRRSQLSASKAALEQALSAARAYQRSSERSVRRDIADITNLLGEVEVSLGNLAEGERMMREAQRAAQDDEQLLGFVHNNLGYVHLRRADSDRVSERAQHLARSIEEHLRARDYAARADDRQELSGIENNLATLYERVGDVRGARAHYQAALQLLGDTDDPLRSKFLYRGLGNIYLTLGDYEKAELFLRQALTISEQFEGEREIRLYCQLGIAVRERHRLAEAIAAHTLCRERAAAAKDVRVRAEALSELTIDYEEQGSSEQAWETIEKAMELLPDLQPEDRDAKSRLLAQQARASQARGDKVAARQSVRQAIEIAEYARYPTAKVDALSAAMSIYREQGRLREALDFGNRTMDVIDSIHAQLDAERLGPAWSARTQGVYAELAVSLIEDQRRSGRAERLAAALGVVERSRAISLRQQYSAPASLVRQVRDDPLLASMAELANRQAGSADSEGLPLAYYHDHDLLTLSRLSGVGNLPVPPPLDVTRLQSALGSAQVALVYLVTGAEAYLFVVSPTQLNVVDLGSRQELERLVNRLRDELTRDPFAITAPLRELSAMILPMGTIPAAAQWIVVRDGPLHSVPFGALHAGDRRGAYEPVIARRSVIVAPSLSAYFMPRPARTDAYSVDLAVFADPSFQSAAAPLADGPKSWTQRLPRLPWTAHEAKEVAGFFAPDRTLIYTDANATRSNLRGIDVRNARMLHIASHGYFQSSDPDNIGFALSPSSAAGRADSGFITLTELFSYRFNNELVVISGCDSALGLDRGGEGMLSLTRGFISQGASHVLSSLWPVSDRASAEFMAAFYASLVARGSVARALREAQLELRSRPEYANPWFWAPYILTSVAPESPMTFPRSTASTRAARAH
jgi:CHAT domain-containing protein